MATKATILFVHGSWHNPQHFEPIREVFERAGYETSCPAHASFAANPRNSDNWLAADAKVISDEAEKLVNLGKDVVVVMHSYGGIVGSEAINQFLSKKMRAAKGQKGGVTALLYLAAFVVPEGQSLAGALGGGLPPYITVFDDGTCLMIEAEKRLFNDLSVEDQEKYISLLANSPTSTQYTPTTYSAYKHYPSTYLFCTNDKALPLQMQQMMVRMNGGGAFKTVECDAGHSPYLSQPETVLRIVEGLSA